eukprot:TRINITY_DN46837_c0_g1_i1.p1 TRINITY_DN46837_c0_g1~~TRINITY_DN46837_c0_g1_i1.p1  ORF type:complete len:386 (+),score=131.17 TRINITY_DN46837_c0_g1_i1:74-1159(+)
MPARGAKAPAKRRSGPQSAPQTAASGSAGAGSPRTPARATSWNRAGTGQSQQGSPAAGIGQRGVSLNSAFESRSPHSARRGMHKGFGSWRSCGTEPQVHVETTLTPAEEAEVRRLFRQCRARNGCVDFEGLALMLKKINMEPSSAADLRSAVQHLQVTDPATGAVDFPFDRVLNWLVTDAAQLDRNVLVKCKVKAQGKKPLKNAQIAAMRTCFDQFDADGSGSIDISELVEVFRSFGEEVSDDEVTQMMLEVDEDGSGEIDFEEFIMLMMTNFGNDVSAEDEMQGFLERYDVAHTGLISGTQLSELMRELCGDQLSPDEVRDIVASAACAASPLGRGNPTADQKIQYMNWESLWEAVNQDI